MILNKTFPRYFVIGVSTVFIDFGLLQVLSGLGMEKVVANIFSVLISVVFNFFMQNYWSFRAGSSNALLKSIRYLSLTAFNYFVNTYGFFLIYKQWKIEDVLYKRFSFIPDFIPDGFLSKIIITIPIMCWNFFLFKYWVFKNSKTQKDE